MSAENNPRFNRNILVAVDESPNARRAVFYVARLLGGIRGFTVSLMHVISAPEEDFFPSPSAREAHHQKRRQEMERLLEEYRQILLEHGFEPREVSIHAPERNCPSIAECILSERETLNHGTLVIGRKGLSRQEEFLFGSVSSKIVSKAKGCAVWVVE